MDYPVEINFPGRIILRSKCVELLGLELAVMGFRNIIVLVSSKYSNVMLEFVIPSFSRIINKVSVTNIPSKSYDSEVVDEVTEKVRGSEVIVAAGDWITLSLAKLSSARLNLPSIFLPLSPGVREAFSVRAIPPFGTMGYTVPIKAPLFTLFDPVLFNKLEQQVVSNLAVETLVNAIEAAIVGSRNKFILLLSCTALNELKHAVFENNRSLERILLASLYAGLAYGHLRGTALSALSKAIYVLLGLDAYLAEYSLFLPWLRKVSDISDIKDTLGVSNVIEWVLKTIEHLHASSVFSKLNIAPRKADLIVEYAWTYDFHSVRSDPTVPDKYFLRELILEASGTKA
ncbi:MAG: iron-containing alcohol dehydrogenase [Thermofilaceae archaeon]|nr:iron-containing alcohol dehydrogenase [Thermofilaceae archaeon]MDW8004827.1 iron-containing alcohol dehydrogenase [Thermofilaceae archaeon]